MARLRAAGLPCPEPLLRRRHLLLMSFVGEARQAAPKLCDAPLDAAGWASAHEQALRCLRCLWHDYRLVHADFNDG